jgi:Protein of unknown function (DUF4231)
MTGTGNSEGNWFTRLVGHRTKAERDTEQEVQQLFVHLGQQLNSASSADKDFLEFRFRRRAANYLRLGRYNSVSNTFITLLIVAGGFATSGIAVAAGGGRGSKTGWIVFAIGIVVAVAGAIARLFNPETRALELKSIVAKMIAEAWDFIENAGVYASATSQTDSFPLFRETIESLNRQADGLPNQAPQAGRGTRKQPTPTS